jgi:hypothetical protein
MVIANFCIFTATAMRGSVPPGSLQMPCIANLLFHNGLVEEQVRLIRELYVRCWCLQGDAEALGYISSNHVHVIPTSKNRAFSALALWYFKSN